MIHHFLFKISKISLLWFWGPYNIRFHKNKIFKEIAYLF